MSPLLMTLVSFAVILILARLRTPLGLSVLAGAAALGIFFGVGVGGFIEGAWSGVTSPSAVGLLLILGLLTSLSQVMDRTGQLRRIVELTSVFLRRPAVAMAALPALIGLLPMPGGALFSAPMVDAADKDTSGASTSRGDLLSAINYWWRHIWEPSWPLYPGVILAIAMVGTDAGQFALHQLPMSLSMAVGGLFILRKTHPALRALAPRPPAGTWRQLIRATAGIWGIFVVWGAAAGTSRLIFGPAPHATPGGPALTQHEELVKALHDYVPLLLGLVMSLAWMIRSSRISAGDLKAMNLPKKVLPLLGLVLTIVIFQAELKQADAAARIGEELRTNSVPAVLVIAALPAIAGVVTGLAYGFVGVSFPIVLKLAADLPDTPSIWPYVVLAYGCGHLGMMLSPLHLCYVVSNQYFQTSFRPVYRHIAPAAVVQIVALTTYVLVLLWLM